MVVCRFTIIIIIIRIRRIIIVVVVGGGGGGVNDTQTNILVYIYVSDSYERI